jgi:hypothetical protein
METVSFSIRANPQFGLLIGRVFTTKRGRGSFGFMRGFRGCPAEELVPSRWSIAREKNIQDSSGEATQGAVNIWMGGRQESVFP